MNHDDRAEVIDLTSLNDFVNRVADLGGSYTIKKARPEAVMVLVATTVERWEVEFMTEDWSRIEVERYKSLGPPGDDKLLPELWERLNVAFTRGTTHQDINEFLNGLDSAKVAYEVLKIHARGVAVRVYVPGQYWEVCFLTDDRIAIERFESSGEIFDGSALNVLWQLLQDK